MIEWAQHLIAWYLSIKRPMPWRDNPTPYYVWISEMMLQQTQVATVIPYFERFMSRFPTVFDLARADEQDVLKAWEGLGYYTRARNLHKAAQIVVNGQDGVIPDSFATLQLLPGLGPYAAAAVASIAFGEPVPSVDGNFLRVFARFWGITESISNMNVKKDVFSRLQSVIALVDPSSFNQGVMELGATLCKPKNPRCVQCPLAYDCWALKHGRVGDIPLKTKIGKVPHIEVGAAIIWHGNKILITKRPEGKMLAGLWEFPGGKQEPTELIQDTIIREILEETSLAIRLKGELGVYRHAYSHFTLRLHAWHAVPDDIEKLIIDGPYKWVSVDELSDFPFPEVDRKIIRDLRKFDTRSIL
jgi:A/G-specific adenine glycosylase